MGRASSAKKVQRVARASGRSSSSRRSIFSAAAIFPTTIVVVVVLGIALVAFGKIQSEDEASATPALGDHWHAAVGVYICDDFIEPMVDQNGDANGIHTHGDNVMHIHPNTSAATGENATLGVWTEEVGIEFGEDSITLPNGDTYANGDDCGGQPGRVRVVAWPSAADTTTGRTPYSEGFEDIHFDQDGMAFTIAFVPEGVQVPPPQTASNLEELGALDSGGQSGGSTTPADPSSGVQVDPATGLPIDPATGQPIDPTAVDPATGQPIDPTATDPAAAQSTSTTAAPSG